MEKSDNPYLAQIVRNIEKVRAYVGDEGFDAFKIDEKTQSAVLMQLQQIGELAKRISPQAQTEMSAIPWRDVADFRNVVAHDYYEVQLPIVWTIVTEQLVPLEAMCTEYMQKHQ